MRFYICSIRCQFQKYIKPLELRLVETKLRSHVTKGQYAPEPWK